MAVQLLRNQFGHPTCFPAMVGQRSEVHVKPIESISGNRFVTHRECLLAGRASLLDISLSIGYMNRVSCHGHINRITKDLSIRLNNLVCMF